MSVAPHVLPDVTQRPRSVRRYFVVGSLVLTLITVIGAVVVLFTPVPIVVSKETTYLTEPLDAEGYVDYLEAMNRRASEGVTPANNALVPLLQAAGPTTLPAEFYKRLGGTPKLAAHQLVPYTRAFSKRGRDETWDDYDAARMRPWSAEEFPRIAEWLDVNAEALELIVQASRRTRYYAPYIADDPPRTFNTELPDQKVFRDLTDLLRARAMFHLHRKEFSKAREDLLGLHRLARLMASGSTWQEHLEGIALENRASHADAEFAKAAVGDPHELRALKAGLDQLPEMPPRWKQIDESERAVPLDVLTSFERNGIATLPTNQDDADLKQFPIQLIDWNAALRRLNAWVDRGVKIMKEPKWTLREPQLKQIDRELAELRNPRSIGIPLQGVRQRIGEFVGDKLAARLVFSFKPASQAAERTQMRRELTRVVLALSIWRSEHGSYPATLAELSPSLLDAIPLDRFTDAPLVYEQKGDGYSLRSLGANRRRDPGYEDDIFCEVP